MAWPLKLSAGSWQILAQAVSLLLYLVWFAGLILAFGRVIDCLKKRYQLRRRLGKPVSGGGKHNAALVYINNILFTTLKGPGRRKAFIFLEISMFAGVLILGMINYTPLFALLSAFIMCALPLLALSARLEAERNKGSREGISLVSELYRQYRMNNLNIFAALEGCVSGNGDYPVLKRHVSNLLIRMRSACGSAELRQAVDSFSFATGTVWGRMLGQCIRLAAENGTDVSSGLADIASQLKTAASEEKEREKLNSEAVRMAGFLVPFMYAASMFAAVHYLGVTPARLFRNQFLVPEGFTFFLISLFMFMLNNVLLKVAAGARMDY